jgi:hypothetical protein
MNREKITDRLMISLSVFWDEEVTHQVSFILLERDCSHQVQSTDPGHQNC